VHFNTHLNLAGTHAFLSASNYHWINYDEDKLDRMYIASMAARRGTELHAFAHEAIRLGVKLPDEQKTLNLYVNDGIGFQMKSEQTLFYSRNCYGTADCIGFRRETLRIHDLKTGLTEASPHQLEVYAAIFCLEYKKNPLEIRIELRIYQNNEIRIYEADPDNILHIMDRIRFFDRRIEAMRLEAEQ
jgi:hypothetical protein